MSGIPTSNKPVNESKPEASVVNTEEFEAKLKASIQHVKEVVDLVQSETHKTEKLKVETLWNVGNDIAMLTADLKKSERRNVIVRFTREAGMSESFYYLALQMVRTFSEETCKAAVEKGLTVRVLKALVAVKDPDLRAKLLKKAIEEGLDESSIRTITGTKAAKKAAPAEKDGAKIKPPLKVFSQGIDRMVMAEQTISECTDAVGRLATVTDPDAKQNALKALLQLRGSAERIIADAQSFLKFTAGFKPEKK